MKSNLIRIKVCGMRDPENIRDVAALRPDYMGYIFYEKSPRYVNSLLAPPDSTISRVGVFVNEDPAVMTQKARQYQMEFIQLHGDESPEMCKLMKASGFKVIKVFRVDHLFDFDQTSEFASFADYFMFDTKGEKFGGNALPFDWNILEKYDQRVPFFLSGGLNPASILELGKIKQMNIHALDLNSGIEESPAVKSIVKVTEAINNLNKINYHGIPGR